MPPQPRHHLSSGVRCMPQRRVQQIAIRRAEPVRAARVIKQCSAVGGEASVGAAEVGGPVGVGGDGGGEPLEPDAKTAVGGGVALPGAEHGFEPIEGIDQGRQRPARGPGADGGGGPPVGAVAGLGAL